MDRCVGSLNITYDVYDISAALVNLLSSNNNNNTCIDIRYSS